MDSALVVCAAPSPACEAFYRDLISGHAGPIIAADGGATLCLAVGRVPDVLVGDFDSVAPDVLARVRAAGVPVIASSADKDVSDLDLALQAVKDLGTRRAAVTAAWSARLDHTLAAIGSVFVQRSLAIDLTDPGMAGCLLDSGERASVTLTGAGATFSVFTLDPGAVLSCRGARYELDHASLDPLSARGLSNRLLAKPAVVTAERGRALVISYSLGNVRHATFRFVPA
ncbi:MAG: thiamine diphosphokinase [Anaerosomatales bacterium]|nr:thiamine diphosphokinase [Anaerosomatales bacterium]MDT8433432.1 thiamine diphosphokinase [Anaerosomatales bacterium]